MDKFFEDASLTDLAREGGRHEPVANADAELEAQCRAVIAQLPENHGAMMAKSKLSEMLHWIRASRAARLV